METLGPFSCADLEKVREWQKRLRTEPTITSVGIRSKGAPGKFDGGVPKRGQSGSPRMFNNRVPATFQLNVRNVTEKGRLQPVTAYPNGVYTVFRIGRPASVHPERRRKDRKIKSPITGPFCSELVAGFFERVGIPVFDDGRRARTVTPGDLWTSKLVRVENAVVRAADFEIGQLSAKARNTLGADQTRDLYDMMRQIRVEAHPWERFDRLWDGYTQRSDRLFDAVERAQMEHNSDLRELPPRKL